MTYQKETACFLCKKRHNPSFHAYVKRTYHAGELQFKSIKVSRIYCAINHRKRKQQKKNIQYTLTVLPSFLQPYSHIPVGSILSGITAYITGDADCYASAALDMNAESDRTFRTYFYRFRKRIIAWLTLLEQLIAMVAMEVAWEKKPAKSKNNLYSLWNECKKRIAFYCGILEAHQLPGNILLRKELYTQYVFALFSHTQGGLGP